jgi:hypothetical protein
MRTSGAALALVCPAFICDRGAEAAEWYLEPRLEQQAEYDDNVTLESGSDKISAYSTTSSIEVTTGVRTEIADVQLYGLFDFNRFPEERQLNSNDQLVRLRSSHNGEQASISVFGEFVRDSSRTDDVEDTGDEFIRENRQRYTYSLGPEIAYRITPLDEVRFDASFSNTHYPSNDLRDFEEWLGRLGWGRYLTEQTQALAALTGRWVTSGDSGSENSQSGACFVGLGHAFSENLEASLVAGPTVSHSNFTEEEGGTRRSENDVYLGYGGALEVSYDVEDQLNIMGQVARGVTPSSSSGQLAETTTATLRASYQALQDVFLEGRLGFTYRDTVGGREEDTGGGADDTTSGERYSAFFEPSVRWQLTEDWSFLLSYRWRWQTFEGGDDSAMSNAVFANLSYRLPRLSLSR